MRACLLLAIALLPLAGALAQPLPRVELTLTCYDDDGCHYDRLFVEARACAGSPGQLALVYSATHPPYLAEPRVSTASLAPTGDPACPFEARLTGSISDFLVSGSFVCGVAAAAVVGAGGAADAERGCSAVVP